MRGSMLIMAAGLLVPVCALASPNHVALGALRLDVTPARTELVLSLSAPTEHSLFTLSHPDRIVIDVDRVDLKATLPAGQGLVSSLRSGMHEGNLRLVLDLNDRATPRTYLRQSAAGTELVVDLYPNGAVPAAVPVTAAIAAAPAADTVNRAPAPIHSRDIVVAIDAGHGGKDPGAHGPHGALEKNVTLAVARRLAELVDQQPGMKAILTRDSDVYVPLMDRFMRARHANADLFVSIHCDASRDHGADGATVYVLSEHGATTEHAKMLERQENEAYLVGGVNLSGLPPEVKSVVVDMSQSAVMGMSFDVGASVARQLAAIGAMHRNSVQQAGFLVLKAPDVPSMLIETNYITNPRTAKLLQSADYQQQLAKAIFTGVAGYFDRYPPPGTALALLKLRDGQAPASAAMDYADNSSRK